MTATRNPLVQESLMFGFINGQVQSRAINVDALSDTDLAELIAHPATHREVQRYAQLTEAARKCRVSGDIALAMRLETKAEAVYDVIPRALRW
jgi:hypothetical protein